MLFFFLKAVIHNLPIKIVTGEYVRNEISIIAVNLPIKFGKISLWKRTKSVLLGPKSYQFLQILKLDQKIAI
jgi:hypothetical protein